MNRIFSLFGIWYSIIQGDMVWYGGRRFASVASSVSSLGLIGPGSMCPDILCEHIRKCCVATDRPSGVSIPSMYPQIEEIMNTIVEEEIKIVFTFAGNSKTWTDQLKKCDITTVHVVSSSKFAVKCKGTGVDAVVAEGSEAGGYNGREETMTLCLIPVVHEATILPLIVAGGIGTGEAIFVTMALGAEGVQIGTRFALTDENSASGTFKEYCLRLNGGDTRLSLKKLAPTYLVADPFHDKVEAAKARGVSVEKLRELLGRGRIKKDIFEDDLEEEELEIGQAVVLLHRRQSADEVVKELLKGYHRASDKISSFLL